MNIKIGEDYTITSDSMNIIVNEKYQKKTKEGEEEKFDFKPIAFYPNVVQACIAIMDKKLINNDAKEIVDLMLEVKKAKAEILAAIAESSVCK